MYVKIIFTIIFFTVSLWATTPTRPFPQNISYTSGTITPSHYSQAEQNLHVSSFYDYWKESYLVPDGVNPAGDPVYRIAFGKGSDATVSEGQGYGMVIVALMAGYDSNAQDYFDGLWKFSRLYPANGTNHLMSWKIENKIIVRGANSAFDGDADMAYGLLLADKQWGSTGSIDYKAEAIKVINEIKTLTIGPQSNLPMLGDLVDPDGIYTKASQYTPRSSDFMLVNFRAFLLATNDDIWQEVITSSQDAMIEIQKNHSPSTGLLPDFLVNCNPLSSCSPAPSYSLEWKYDDSYSYNAGRVPWRVGLDSLLSGDSKSKQIVTKMIDWLDTDTNGDGLQINSGFYLDGTAISTAYFTTFFAAPFAVGTMNTTKQSFLNSIYSAIYDREEKYYEDSVNLLSLLVLTGNHWTIEEDKPKEEVIPLRPFPQNITYLNGAIKPSCYSEVEQNLHVSNFYDYWKESYLVEDELNPLGEPLYRVALAKGSATTVSEGQGFGMIILALMAGYDSNAQDYFDGLWKFSRTYPTHTSNDLMSWKIQYQTRVWGVHSAFDGDADIAYALLLADKQWGSTGLIDYKSEAIKVINAIKTFTIGPQSHLPMLGDWVDPDGVHSNNGVYSNASEHSPRSSDFMLVNFRAFLDATKDNTWQKVITASQDAMIEIQKNHSPSTGLLPDFLANCNPISSCTPAPSDFLQGIHDNDYSYNAGRTPWRVGFDALLFGDNKSKQIVKKMIDWLDTDSNGDGLQIKSGFHLDGTEISDEYFTTFFAAPFAVGTMNTTKQSFLNSIYLAIYDREENYYEDSVNMLSLLVLTGNHWSTEDAKSKSNDLSPVIMMLLN